MTELPNSDILQFTVNNANPALSRRLVSAYANEFTVYRHQLDVDALHAAQKQVQARIAELAKNGDTSGPLYNNLSSANDLLSTMITLQTSNSARGTAPTGSTQSSPSR